MEPILMIVIVLMFMIIGLLIFNYNIMKYGHHIKKYCKRCNTLLSNRTKRDYCNTCNTIILTEECINKGLPMTPKRLRNYLIIIRGHKCEECELTTWFGKPIPLDNHHIDGDWKNNKLTNLKLECKNCHALTDTYGSKNNGNGRPFTKKCKSTTIVVSK